MIDPREPAPFEAARAFAEVRKVLEPVRDILEGRVESEEPPRWCSTRGWEAFLLGLDDVELSRCEAEGLSARAAVIAGAPAGLVALAADIAAVTRLPVLAEEARSPSEAALRAVSLRKRTQLGALLGALGPMAEHAARIVDVGAGSGHFTRLAAEMFARDVIGIERDAARVAAATARAEQQAPAAGAARFVAMDASREALSLAAGDLAVGLHACGELGDRLVSVAAEAGSDVALVSCCLQKIGVVERAPLARAAAGFTLRRDILGLANLTSQPQGVEVSIDATLAAREARHALLGLLRARGVAVAPGEEMRGINRRRARGGLAEIAAPALAQRGLAPATEAEIREHEAEARRQYASIRRLSLPRSMLGRLVEVAVVLDRAAMLEEKGYGAEVATITSRAATPRNLAIFASRSPERLPRVAR
ncbi:SAM-dependent methyltransferase [Minicystis rosea]|nr:SAM-dependent methyltransferase [Minicystis rosea]